LPIGRGDETADDAGGDHVEGGLVQLRPPCREREDVENQRHRQHAEGEDDQHLMDGMTEQFGPTFHAFLRRFRCWCSWRASHDGDSDSALRLNR
jgi:hypothetical protein